MLLSLAVRRGFVEILWHLPGALLEPWQRLQVSFDVPPRQAYHSRNLLADHG